MSVFPFVKNNFARANQLFGSVLVQCWAVVFWSSLVLKGLDQYFIWLGEQGDDQLRLLGGLGGFCVGIFYSVWLSLLIPVFAHVRHLTQIQAAASGLPVRPVRPNLAAHFRHFTSPLTIESLRALGKILLGFIFLIVPGFICIFRYYFVPFVVQFDPRYDAGEIDALQESKDLWPRENIRFPLAVLGILFVFDILWSISTFRVTIFQSPALFIGISALDMMFEVYGACLVYSLYVELKGWREKVGPAAFVTE